MNMTRRSIRLLALGMLTAISAAGCSDKSRLNIVITGIHDSASVAKTYIEADVFGNTTKACATIQETARIEVEQQGHSTIGPSYGARINRAVVDYFYYEPTDGILKGPNTGLTLVLDNLGVKIPSG